MSCHNPNNQPIDSKHFCYHINMTEQPVTVQPYIDKVAKAEALARITATLAPFQRRVERRPGFPKTEEAHAINAARPQQTKIENVIQLLEKRTENGIEGHYLCSDENEIITRVNPGGMADLRKYLSQGFKISDVLVFEKDKIEQTDIE